MTAPSVPVDLTEGPSDRGADASGSCDLFNDLEDVKDSDGFLAVVFHLNHVVQRQIKCWQSGSAYHLHKICSKFVAISRSDRIRFFTSSPCISIIAPQCLVLTCFVFHPHFIYDCTPWPHQYAG